jgi:hypothetical protein
MSNLIFQDQRSFMRYFNQEPGSATAKLYKSLCDEEYGELQAAWQALQDRPCVEHVTEVADACLDLIYVAIGLMHGLGLEPAQALWDEVHRSNIDKLKHPCLVCEQYGVEETDGSGDPAQCPACKGQGHVYEVRLRKDGKVIKPAGWRAPELQAIIEQMTGKT